MPVHNTSLTIAVRPSRSTTSNPPRPTHHAQAALREEELLVADMDTEQATQAMFKFDRDGFGDMLFGHSEFATAGPMRIGATA